MVYSDLTQAEKDLIISEANNTNGDYKCILNLFLIGAWDSYGALIPYGSNPNLTHYLAHRDDGIRDGYPFPGPETTKSRVDDDDTPINPIRTNNNNKPDELGTANWRLHPSFEYLKVLWDQGKVAFFHDVGVVKRVTTKENFLSGDPIYRPINLYSHIDQQQIIQKGVVDDFFPTTADGWSGRSAEYIDNTFNINDNILSNSLTSSFLISGYLIQGQPPVPFFPTTLPAQTINSGDKLSLNSSKFQNTLDKMTYSDTMGNPSLPNNNLFKSFVEVFNTYRNDQSEIDQKTKDLPDSISAIFQKYIDEAASIPHFMNPQASILKVKQAVKAIYNRTSGQYRQRRQIININFSVDWDMHFDLRYRFDVHTKGLDLAIRALVESLQHPDMNDGRSDGKTLLDEVLIQSQSDFGRTLDNNSRSGVDHGWAGIQFAIGNMINGGLYPEGYTPNYDRNGPKSDESRRVRFIPEVSVLQTNAKILNWFGIPEELLHHLLPGLIHFTTDGTPENNLNFVFPSGNYTLNFI